jgi:hypothetical protein
VVGVLVRIRHAVAAVVRAEGAAVVREIHAIVGGTVVDLGKRAAGIGEEEIC